MKNLFGAFGVWMLLLFVAVLLSPDGVATVHAASSGLGFDHIGIGALMFGTTLAVTNPTILDVMKRTAPGGGIDQVVEILMESNEILEDMTWIEGNLPTGHRTTVRSGLPEATWRKLNYGVQPSKSTTVQVTDNCGMLEAYAEVDKSLADLNGNTAAYRLSEDTAFIQGMNKEFASTLVYGNEGTEPEAFTGFMPRFNLTSAQNGENIILADGTPSANVQSSILLVGWGPNTVHGIYPKGSPAGLQTKDLGEQTLTDAAGGKYQGYRTHYKWDCGLTVRDWQYVVRIANIDVARILAGTTGFADLIKMMTRASELIPNMGLCRPVFYMPRTVRGYLREQINDRVANSTLSVDTIAGKRVLNFDGIPVRRCDAMLKTEAVVS